MEVLSYDVYGEKYKKAYILYGLGTQAIKEDIKMMGGKWNIRIVSSTRHKGVWVFPGKKEEAIKEYFKGHIPRGFEKVPPTKKLAQIIESLSELFEMEKLDIARCIVKISSNMKMSEENVAQVISDYMMRRAYDRMEQVIENIENGFENDKVAIKYLNEVALKFRTDYRIVAELEHMNEEEEQELRRSMIEKMGFLGVKFFSIMEKLAD